MLDVNRIGMQDTAAEAVISMLISVEELLEEEAGLPSDFVMALRDIRRGRLIYQHLCAECIDSQHSRFINALALTEPNDDKICRTLPLPASFALATLCWIGSYRAVFSAFLPRAGADH
jgi:hypothetical protein